MLVVLLVLSNLLVGYLYVELRNTKYYLPNEFCQEAKDNLNSRGIDVLHNGINPKKQNIPIYTAQSCENEEIKQILKKTASVFVGEITEEPSAMTAPDSISISCKGNEKSVVLTITDNIYLECSSSDFNTLEQSDALREVCGRNTQLQYTVDPKPAHKSTIEQFYEAFYKNNSGKTSSNIDFKYCMESNLHGATIVSTVGTLDKIAIPHMTMSFVFDQDDNLLYARGAVFSGEIEKAYAEKLIDGVNAVYQINLDEVSEIVDESFAFSVVKIENKRYYFVPSWSVEIVGSDGKGRVLLFDSITGESKGAYELE